MAPARTTARGGLHSGGHAMREAAKAHPRMRTGHFSWFKRSTLWRFSHGLRHGLHFDEIFESPGNCSLGLATLAGSSRFNCFQIHGETDAFK